MPWKECHVMDERVRFISRLLDGEKMARLCAEFGISRKTGYKIYRRYKGCGVEGLTDRSRRPQRHANQLPEPIEKLILRLKREYPTWGAPKIRERLRRRYTPTQCPAISTVHAVFDRHGLVTRRKRRHRAQGTALTWPDEPNALWCADYKGEFMLADRRYCYPLTITDFASRYLLSCEALTSPREAFAFAVFERAFKDFGLPQVIRDRQRRALRVAVRPLRPEPAGGVVAAARHPDRTHQTGSPGAEWAARADAPDAEEGSDEAGRRQRPPTASPLRYLHRPVQSRAAAPGPGDEGPGRGLQPVAASLSRAPPRWTTRCTTGRPP